MKQNMGTVDRIIRVVLGVAGLVAAIAVGGWVWILGAVGIIFLATAVLGFCPLYALFRISTRGQARNQPTTA